jgi:hypothetical protein
LSPGTLLPIGTALGAALVSSALLLAPVPCRAGAVMDVEINGATDEDVQDVTATATASTSGPSASGSVTASGDLASGTLTAIADGDAFAGIGGNLDAQAFSELTDALTLIPDVGSPTDPVLFTLFMDVDGALLVDGTGVPTAGLVLAIARATATIQLSGFAVTNVQPATVTVTRRVEASGGVVQTDATTADTQQNAAGSVDTDGFDMRLTATAMVTPNSAVSFSAGLAAEAIGDAGFSSTSDLSQTAQLGVVVPAGYTLASSSGVFLTVPEPRASAAFALTAVGVLAVFRRRAPA